MSCAMRTASGRVSLVFNIFKSLPPRIREDSGLVWRTHTESVFFFSLSFSFLSVCHQFGWLNSIATITTTSIIIIIIIIIKTVPSSSSSLQTECVDSELKRDGVGRKGETRLARCRCTQGMMLLMMLLVMMVVMFMPMSVCLDSVHTHSHYSRGIGQQSDDAAR